MNLKLLFKAGQAAVVMTLLDMVIFSGFKSATGLALGFVSSLLILSVVGYYIVHSSLTGLRLLLSTFIIYYGVGYFNILNEAWIFNVTDRTEMIDLLMKGFVLTIMILPLYVYLLDKLAPDSIELKFSSRTVFSWIWRLLLADLLYIVVYITFGLVLQTVYPEFMEFYKERTMPSPGLVLGTQVFRGFVFAGMATLLLRSTNLSRSKKALLTGVLFSVLGGIAPLILPNEFMPLYVRMGHIFEVGISNFLYGFAIAFLLGQQSHKMKKVIFG